MRAISSALVQIIDGQLAGESDHNVDRFRRDRLHHGGDLLARSDAGRIEAFGSSVRIGLEPPDRPIEIGTPADKTFAACDLWRLNT